MRCLDFYANSPDMYHKKYMKNSEEKMPTDIGAERDKVQFDYART